MVYRAKDIAEIGWAHFVTRRLRTWLGTRHPQTRGEPSVTSLDAPASAKDSEDRTVADTVASQADDLLGPSESSSTWQFRSEQFPDEPPAFVAPDETGYYTVEQAARRYGETVDKLRYLDRRGHLRALRVRDLAGRTVGWTPSTRLYPATPESDAEVMIALNRLATHSASLTGNDLNRNQAARHLGVSVSQLRRWEREGRLTPGQNGRLIVYTPEHIEKARTLIAEREA